MASLYGPAYDVIWRDALCLPGHPQLLGSFAVEAASFLGVSEAEAARRLEEAWNCRTESQRVGLRQRKTKEDIQQYYVAQEYGVLASLYWHSLLPDRWALHSVAALHNVLQFGEGRRVFEFGHGVGSTGILFARNGFDVTLGDISPAYRRMAELRFRLRGLKARFLDLVQEGPEPEAFDAVVSLDVIEHIPNPIPELRKLHACLKPGGVMILNICFGRDPAMPEHVLYHRLGVLDRIRSLGFERVPSTPLLVYYKRELSTARRMLYRIQDVCAAAVEDLNYYGVPGIWRLTRTAVPPLHL